MSENGTVAPAEATESIAMPTDQEVEDLEARIDALLRQVEAAPKRRRLRAQDEEMRAGIVGDQLRRTGGHEIVVARIRHFDGRMHGGDRSQHFINRVFGGARRQAAHGQAAQAAWQQGYFSESMFVRMRVLASDGHWPPLPVPARAEAAEPAHG